MLYRVSSKRTRFFKSVAIFVLFLCWPNIVLIIFYCDSGLLLCNQFLSSVTMSRISMCVSCFKLFPNLTKVMGRFRDDFVPYSEGTLTPKMPFIRRLMKKFAKTRVRYEIVERSCTNFIRLVKGLNNQHTNVSIDTRSTVTITNWNNSGT